jgi:hypothetical protein
MRALFLAAMLLVAALPLVAGPAAACHPALQVEHQEAGFGVRLGFDMGCGHELPYELCVAAWGPGLDLMAVCGPVP